MSLDAGGAATAAHIRVRSEGGVAWITLDRPGRLNALAGTMRDDLAAAVAAAARDGATRVIVITGAGRAFCAGADVDTMAALLREGRDHEFAGLVQAGVEVVRQIRAARQPVIAAVNGVAVGAGASLATACDLRIASNAASIGFTFNRIGLHPDWGATYFLPRLVGAGRAAELLLTARMVPAAEARDLGLFERVVPTAEFSERVAELAADLAAKPPLALERAKATLSGSLQNSLNECLRLEAAAQLECFRTGDAREGISAFLEKRSPLFSGR